MVFLMHTSSKSPMVSPKHLREEKDQGLGQPAEEKKVGACSIGKFTPIS